MRNEEVVKAFHRREEAKNSTGSLWTTGDCLYSYFTCIAEFNNEGELYINLTKYSTTTSHHQALVNKHLFNSANRFLYNIERNKVHIIPTHERR